MAEDVSDADRRALEIDAARAHPRSGNHAVAAFGAAALAAIGAPLLWFVSFSSFGVHAPTLWAGVLLAAIPSALLVGSLAAFASEHAAVVASFAFLGQVVASFVIGFLAGMALDGHSDAAAHFSALPFFAPAVVYPLVAAAGALVGIRRR